MKSVLLLVLAAQKGQMQLQNEISFDFSFSGPEGPNATSNLVLAALEGQIQIQKYFHFKSENALSFKMKMILVLKWNRKLFLI